MNSEWFLSILYGLLDNDPLQEASRFVATTAVAVCLFWFGRHNRLNQLPGWNLLSTGFLMLSISCFADAVEEAWEGLTPINEKAAEFVLEFIPSMSGYALVILALFRLTPIILRFDKVNYMANHDVLTGLPNRHMIADLFQNMQQTAAQKNHLVGLMFLDLDNFKPINDKLGHNAGDKALKIIGERLNECVRTADAVGRLGGDEFVILLHKLSDKSDLKIIAKKVITAVQAPIYIKSETFNLSASIGGAVFPEHGTTLEELLANADKAMYSVKTQGKSGYLLATDPDRGPPDVSPVIP